MWEKLKSILDNDTIFIAILMIIVGVASFGLGRLSVLDDTAVNSSQNSLTQLQSLDSSFGKAQTGNQPVVVSKSGTKYHLLDCPGALQMNPENQIEFNSAKEARAAGYTPAANCPGLE